MSVVSAEAIRGHLPLVHQVVGQLCRRLPANVQRDDLLSAGVFGLVDSLCRRGGDDGDGFEIYARVRIRGAVVDELRAQDWLSRRARDAVSGPDAQAQGKIAPICVSLSDLTTVEDAIDMRAANDSPEDRMVARLDQRALVRALERLPERERTVVAMYYFEGRKLREIGAAFAISEPRVSQLLSRAIERLRGFLARAA
jgi:RNA polymerase sigma factor for flagellar operon FliA